MSEVLYQNSQNDREKKSKSMGQHCYESLKSNYVNQILLIEANSKEEITSEKLLDASVKLARYFREIGLTRSDIISIISENTWKYLTVILAGFYTGIPINTINPNFTEYELKSCFSIVDPKLVFCSANALDTLLNFKNHNNTNITEIIVFDDVENKNVKNYKSIINNYCEDRLFEPEEFDAKETVAVILFSSGTSGLPKAVQITHHNLKNVIEFLRNPEYVGANKYLTTIDIFPMFHILGFIITFTAILFTSKCIIGTKFVPIEYLKMIQNHKVTHLFVVPPLLLFLAKDSLVEQFDLSSIKSIICGGAPAGKDVQILVQKRFTNAKILQIYGLTEISGVATMTPPNCTCSKYGSVGVPLKGTTVKIVDTITKKTVNSGCEGEICIKNSGVMKGYYKNLEATTNTIDKDGFLKTGDLGYFDEDGYLFIIDRLKEIFKYKGYQVSPSELENVLLKHEEIVEAAVIGKPDERAGELPVAYVTKQSNSTLTEEDIVQYVAEHIVPEKRLHGGVVFVDKIPKNSTGKILRRILRDQLKETLKEQNKNK